MKRYSAEAHLTLVGKAWEIRHHLRQIAKVSHVRPDGKTTVTLGEYLGCHRPKR